MNMHKFHGVIPPVVTPLDKDKNFDQKSFEKLINYLIDARVDGLFVLGSSGSVAFLTGEERCQVLACAVKVVAGRVPILAGVIDTQTNRVIENIKTCEEFGVDGVVATAPFYAIDDANVVENHFRLLRKSTSLPIFAYDVPVCVNKKLMPDMLIRLAKDGVIQGVKDSSGDDVSFRILLQKNEEAGHTLLCFTGHELVCDGTLLWGADGIVPGLGNVDPKLYVDMWNASLKQDWNLCKKYQEKAVELMQVALCEKSTSGFGSAIGGFLAALMHMGIVETCNVPDPSLPLNDNDINKVKDMLSKLSYI